MLTLLSFLSLAYCENYAIIEETQILSLFIGLRLNLVPVWGAVMKADNKTNRESVGELEVLRARVAELETELGLIRTSFGKELASIVSSGTSRALPVR